VKQQTLKEPVLMQLDKVMCEYFRAVCFNGKPTTERMIIKQAKSVHSDMKVTDKCTFSKHNNKRLPVRTYVSVGAI
jgi:hypothetical protein